MRAPAFAATLAATALLSATLSPPAAQARERQTTVAGSGGRSVTRDVTREGGDVSSSTTGPNGRSSTRTVDRSASGAQAVVTGPNGRTLKRQTTRTATGSTSTVTASGGKDATVTVTR